MPVREILAAVAATDGSVPEVRKVRRHYSATLRHLPASEILRIAHGLLEEPNDLVRFAAYELIRFHDGASAALRKQEVMDLGADMNSWGAVDSFAFYIAGPAWKSGQIHDRLVASRTQSTNRWWRRAALASTVILNRKPVADRHAERTWSICAALVEDRDDMVVKALSWALRELGKADADAARRFVTEYAGALPARVKREVANKLRTGLKEPGRRAAR